MRRCNGFSFNDRICFLKLKRTKPAYFPGYLQFPTRTLHPWHFKFPSCFNSLLLRTFLKSVSAGHEFFQLSFVWEGLYPWRICCAGVSSFEKCYPTSFQPPYFWMRNLLSFNVVSIFFNKRYLSPTTLKSSFLCLQYLAVWLWHVLMWVYFCLIYLWFTQLLEPPGRLVSFSGFGVYPPFFFFEHFFYLTLSLPLPQASSVMNVRPFVKVSWVPKACSLSLLSQPIFSLQFSMDDSYCSLFSFLPSRIFSDVEPMHWALIFSYCVFQSWNSHLVLFLFWDVFFAGLGLFTIIQYSLFMLVDLKYFSNNFKISVVSTLTSVDCVFSFSLRSLWL